MYPLNHQPETVMRNQKLLVIRCVWLHKKRITKSSRCTLVIAIFDSTANLKHKRAASLPIRRRNLSIVTLYFVRRFWTLQQELNKSFPSGECVSVPYYPSCWQVVPFYRWDVGLDRAVVCVGECSASLKVQLMRRSG